MNTMGNQNINLVRVSDRLDLNDSTVFASSKAVHDAIQGTVNLDGSNLTPDTTVKTVIETWHEGTEWYRVWSDGWIEQGGSGQSGTINLVKAFSSVDYTITSRILSGSGTLNYQEYGANSNKTTVSFAVGTTPVSWYACGY